MEKISTDIYTFENLRKRGYAYVDKTDILWPLVNDSIGTQFFFVQGLQTPADSIIRL